MENDKMYTFEIGGQRRWPAPLECRYTRAEFEEIRHSKPSLYASLFAADVEALEMRREVEGR
jgi:hypothetical protein